MSTDAMSDRLREIVAHKRIEVAEARARGIDGDARPAPPRGFRQALAERVSAGGVGLIAEIKRASPSKGLIRADFDPPAHARAYQAGGAACLSVLTDTRFFQGSAADLIAARAACDLPVLRKDFTVDPWQAGEARAMGADAILIIVAALADAAMAEIEAAAIEAGLDVLVEVHDEAEMDRALRLESRLIGVNNRDLRDFSVDVSRSERIARHAPADALIVAESGIAGADDVRRLRAAGIGCVLVGETLMRADDVAAATRALIAP